MATGVRDFQQGFDAWQRGMYGRQNPYSTFKIYTLSIRFYFLLIRY